MNPIVQSQPVRGATAWHGLAVFGVRLSWDQGPRWPAFPGNTLRGLLGQALFDNVCLFSAAPPHCADCPLNTACAYPEVFKPLQSDRLPPYWLHDWQFSAGRQSCVLHLLQPALQHLEAWLDGINRHLAKAYRGRLAEAVDTASASPLWQGGAMRPVRPTPLPFPQITAEALAWHTQTPLVSKHQGDPIYGALRTRLQRLVNAYGDGEVLPREETPWQARVITRRPFDIRLERRVITGAHLHMELRGITPASQALLGAGALLHAGGETSLGCGRYQMANILEE